MTRFHYNVIHSLLGSNAIEPAVTMFVMFVVGRKAKLGNQPSASVTGSTLPVDASWKCQIPPRRVRNAHTNTRADVATVLPRFSRISSRETELRLR